MSAGPAQGSCPFCEMTCNWLVLGKDDGSWLEKDNLYCINATSFCFYLRDITRNIMLDFSKVLAACREIITFFPLTL